MSTVNLESAINNKDILKIIKIYHAIVCPSGVSS